jgi:Tfp pilus assembly protein PilF
MLNIVRGGKLPECRRTQFTAVSACIMATSTITGIAWGSTLFHLKETAPVNQEQPEQPTDPPASPEPGSLGPHGGEIDGSYTAAEDRAHQTAEFTIPGAYDPIGMGWGYPSGAASKLAIKSLTKAIHRNPKSSNAYCKRAWIYFSLGQYHEAVEDAGKSIHFNPKNADAYQVRSYAYGSLGQEHRMSLDDAKYSKLSAQGP